MKNSFIAYETIYDMLKELPDDLYIKFSRAVFEYGFYGEAPEFSGIEKALWTQIQFCIDNSKEYRKSQSEKAKKAHSQSEPESAECSRSLPKSAEVCQEEPNVNVNENVNENDNTQTDPDAEVCVSSALLKNVGELQKAIYGMVCEHNKTAKQTRKIPVSRNLWDFTCKEMRELLSVVGTDEPLEMITAALQNFLHVAKSDTWQKSFTWRMFVSHYVDYTPDYFSLERYLNSEPATDDATKRPENVFFFANKDNPDFHVETFQAHIEDWKAQGRPEGTDYFKLQNEWEERKCS